MASPGSHANQIVSLQMHQVFHSAYIKDSPDYMACLQA